jgi:glycosyltransferase involved in cell wall biosynthesis
MLKGYQGWAGRSLVGLRALERCADMLKGYEVVIYLASPEVVIAAELFQRSTGVNVRIIPKGTSHVEILSLHGRARLSIGLSIGDAASTSMLEAMAMGSFPIQSWTSCADEWIEDGKSGLLVPPDDPEVVEKAIRKALADDALVDGAAELNYAVVGKRLNYYALKPMTVNIYNTVASEKGII